MTTLKEMLGTANPKEQAQVVQQLLQQTQQLQQRMHQQPISMIVTYYPDKQQATISPVGTSLPFDVVHDILLAAQQGVRRQELAALAKLQADALDSPPA